MHRVRSLIHEVDPYTCGPSAHPWAYDDGGWGGHVGFFRSVVEAVDPDLVVEVGTWKGRSALTMGGILMQRTIADIGVAPHLVCVDTWLGSTEFWIDHHDTKRYGSLRLHDGYPQVYYTFLQNVMHRGLEDVVTPFPQTSTNAARFFLEKSVQADLIYVDASHDYDDVKTDLRVWSRVLSRDGIMFGDDYCDHWSGVVHAVNEHAFENRLVVQTFRYENGLGEAPSDYWIMSREGLDICP